MESFDSEDSADSAAARIGAEFGVEDVGFHVREEKRSRAALEERQSRPKPPSRKQIKRMRRKIWEAKRTGQPVPDEARLAEMEREREASRRRRSPQMGYLPGRAPSPSYAPYRRGRSRSAWEQLLRMGRGVPPARRARPDGR